MFSFPQNVLKKLLALKNTSPERLSEHETKIANRICACSKCGYLWIRKFERLPNRCPHCHGPDWDRPLLTAILAAETSTTTQTPSQQKNNNQGDPKP